MSLHNQCDTALINPVNVSISVFLFETTTDPVVQRASLRKTGASGTDSQTDFTNI